MDQLNRVQGLDPSESNAVAEVSIQNELDEWLLREEIIWKQRSRELWLKEGDRNSRFFHLSTLIRRRRNSIKAIKNDQGSWLRDWEDISKHVCANFQDLFSETVNQFPTDLEGLVPPCISNQDNEQICQIPTRDEIKAVISDMHPFKALGPDGLPAFFFKQYWPIVGDQVCAAVQNFFYMVKCSKS
jgi:hypothetical protein